VAKEITFSVNKTKFKLEAAWSKDKTWWIVDRHGYRNHLLFAIYHNYDIGYELQSLNFCFLWLHISFAWGTGEPLDIEDPTLHF
jgi:hypothetical protein